MKILVLLNLIIYIGLFIILLIKIRERLKEKSKDDADLACDLVIGTASFMLCIVAFLWYILDCEEPPFQYIVPLGIFILLHST